MHPPRAVVLALALVLITRAAFAAGTGQAAQVGSPTTALPPEVVDFLSRRAACLDWISKWQKNPGSGADYESTISALRCDAISGEQLTIRQRYANRPDVVAALDQTWIKIVRRVPVLPAPDEPDRGTAR